MNNSLLMAAICPHPPIIIPEVGRDNLIHAEKTILGMEDLSKQIVETNPDTVIVVTPHSFYSRDVFNIYSDENLSGDFARFSAPQAKINFNNDIEFIKSLENNTNGSFIRFNSIANMTPLDHGSGVPLYYFAKSGYKGRIVVINYAGFGPNEHVYFGEMLRKTILESDKKYIFIASGDLSHKLSPSAPAGYNPEAKLFDKNIVDNIVEGNYKAIINMDPNLRAKAGECAFNSIMTGIGVVNGQTLQNQVLSYEAPFGVGYMVAKF